jgi:hypothetical protein
MKPIISIAVILCGLLLVAGCTTSPTGNTSSAPNLKIELNHGTQWGENRTNNLSVKISMWVSNEKDQQKMAFSNDNTTWSDWVTFKVDPTWTLSTGDGVKTVYMKTRDKDNKESKIASDTIILDMTAPTATARTPSVGQTNVEFTLNKMTMTFSEEMYSSPNDDTHCPFVLEHELGYTPDLTQMRWTSKSSIECDINKLLQPNLVYTVVLDKDHASGTLRDLAGNIPAVPNWNFTARTPKFQVVQNEVINGGQNDESTLLTGEIKNIDTVSYANVDLWFDLSGNGGHLSYMNCSLNQIIVPGATMPYGCSIADAMHLVKNAKVTVGANVNGNEAYTAEVPYSGLSISNLHSSYLPPDGQGGGRYTLTGDVTNKVGGTPVHVWVAVVFGHDNGNSTTNHFVCACWVEPGLLGTGMTCPFTATGSEGNSGGGPIDNAAAVAYGSP